MISYTRIVVINVETGNFQQLFISLVPTHIDILKIFGFNIRLFINNFSLFISINQVRIQIRL